MNSQSNRHGDQGAKRPRARRALHAIVALSIAMSGAVVALSGGIGGAAPAAAATPAPACTYTGVTAISALVFADPGQKVTLNCRHLTASHPYLLVELSLLVAVDPAARPLLTGQIESVPGVLAAISALPEINARSVAFPTTDANGNMTYTYTIPTSQPTDPNAKCPPSRQQINAGIIGCAVAMLDLTTFKPVTAGTFVLHPSKTSLFPPDPTMTVSPIHPHKGQTVKLMDAPLHSTYWWVATLTALGSLLNGSTPPTSIPVTVKAGGKVSSHAFVTPAKYQNEVFTPPKLQGTFVASHGGRIKVKVGLTASLLGFGLSNQVIVPIKVSS